MGFKWRCPVHEDIHVYKGKHTERAVAPCLQCKKDYKIWQYKVEELPQTTTKLPEKLPRTTEYKTVLKASKSTAEIDLNSILKCMERGISTIEHKPEIEKKKGAYYWDHLAWTEQFEILKKLKEEIEK